MQLSVVYNEHQKCPVFQEILPKTLLVIKGSPLDFEYCVILIYRLKVIFVIHISYIGVSVFSLLKKC